MVDRHWSEIAKRRAATPRVAVAQTIAGAPRHGAGISAEAAAASNPSLARLMAERRALEQRMRTATAGGAPGADPRDALRYHVPSMAERRAEFGAWTERRDAQALAAVRNLGTPDSLPPLERKPAARLAIGVPDPSLRATRGEQPGGTPPSADDWLAARLAMERPRHAVPPDEITARRLKQPDRERPRRNGRSDQRQERNNKRAGGGDQLAALGRSLDAASSDLDRQFDEADRKLAGQGGSAEDRREIAKLKKNLGLDNYTKARSKARDKGDDLVAKATVLPDGFRNAERKVADDWQLRRDAIGGEDKQRYMRPLRALSDRVMGMGLSDIEERAAAGKAIARDRRRAVQQEAQADDARRDRALERRRMARDVV